MDRPDRPRRAARHPGQERLVITREHYRGQGRFLVAGFSGGGPYALAVAHGLPDRVIAAGSIGGTGTADTPGSLEDMNRVNQLMVRLAQKHLPCCGCRPHRNGAFGIA